NVTLLCGVVLVMAILVYDAVHKIFAFSPLLMAICRFLLILAAASAGQGGITPSDPDTGSSVWAALVMACYFFCLSDIAPTESTFVALRFWPCAFLAAPLVLGLIVNRGEYQLRAVVLCAFIIVWLLRALSFALWSAQRNVGRCVGALLAVIPLLDLLSICDGSLLLAAIFTGLFLVAL